MFKLSQLSYYIHRFYEISLNENTCFKININIAVNLEHKMLLTDFNHHTFLWRYEPFCQSGYFQLGPPRDRCWPLTIDFKDFFSSLPLIPPFIINHPEIVNFCNCLFVSTFVGNFGRELPCKAWSPYSCNGRKHRLKTCF